MLAIAAAAGIGAVRAAQETVVDSEVPAASVARAQEPAAAVDRPAWEVAVAAGDLAAAVAVVAAAAAAAVVVVVAAAEGGNEL